MNPETVQIGSLVISKSVFDALMVMSGVVVGGLMTYLTTRSIENKRWEAQKQDRLQEHRRQALGLALEWIPPIELAVENAAMIASDYLDNQTSETEFVKKWPNLLHELAKRDLPMRLNVLVPISIQQQTDAIVDEVRFLQSYTLSVKWTRKAEQTEWLNNIQVFKNRVAELRARLSRLKADLKLEYDKTFQ